MGTGAQQRSYEAQPPARGRSRRLGCALLLTVLLLLLSMISNIVPPPLKIFSCATDQVCSEIVYCSDCCSRIMICGSMQVLAFTVNTLADGDLSSFDSLISAFGISDDRHPVTSFSVSFPVSTKDVDADHAELFDGRVYLLLSKLSTPEPRLQVRGQTTSATVHLFGQDVDAMGAGDVVAITTAKGALGYPFRVLEEVAHGNYYAQAVFVTYETFNLTTGHRVKLPTHDRGDGMHWTRAPGNMFSTPRR